MPQPDQLYARIPSQPFGGPARCADAACTTAAHAAVELPADQGRVPEPVSS